MIASGIIKTFFTSTRPIMRYTLQKLFIATSVLICLTVQAHAFETIGIIKSISGDVYLSSPQSHIKAVPNMRLNQGDIINTGSKSSAGLIFEDDTVVSLGPNSEMAIEEFIFDPAKEKLSFITRLVQGTFSFISGQIAKLAPDQVKLETPDATLGVRGTKFLVKVN